MIDITRILSPHCVAAARTASSRKRVLEMASDMLAAEHPELSARKVFDELMNRERLGSTGLGDGVAIPHCRFSCSHIVGAFLTLDSAIDYEAMDDQPVDLLFVLIVPHAETSAHLDILAGLARVFSELENRTCLRAITSDAAAYEQFVGTFSSQAA